MAKKGVYPRLAVAQTETNEAGGIGRNSLSFLCLLHPQSRENEKRRGRRRRTMEEGEIFFFSILLGICLMADVAGRGG